MSVDILGTSWDQCRSTVQYNFTSTETRRLVRTDSPPWLSHSSWTMKAYQFFFTLIISILFCHFWVEQFSILLEDGVYWHSLTMHRQFSTNPISSRVSTYLDKVLFANYCCCSCSAQIQQESWYYLQILHNTFPQSMQFACLRRLPFWSWWWVFFPFL